MKIGVLMTVYEEAEYVEYALKSILPLVDQIEVVEGAYQETLKTNPSKTPRSQDGTIEIIQSIDNPKLNVTYANELSDPQQRNVGLLNLIKKGCDWCLIVDGDEIWDEDGIQELRDRLPLLHPSISTVKLNIQVFVNDFRHYTWQTMSRCFRIEQETRFISDNEIQKYGQYIHWNSPTFWHYAYVKNTDRFITKKNWWGCRGGSDWFVDSKGKYSSPNHTIWEYEGNHPSIMLTHPRYNK